MKLPSYDEAKKRLNAKRKIVCFNDEIKSSIGSGKKYFLKTYGCQMNERDSESLKALTENLGFTRCDDYNDADLVILNTCSIRENAHNKAFGMIGRIKHLKETKDVILGITGCMPQEEAVASKLLKEKAVDFVIGTHNINELPNAIIKAFKGDKNINVYSFSEDIMENIPVKRESSFKAFVNIIYGCDKFCTYCIVPYTRGRERSRSKEDILKEIKELVNDGYKEITLLGQNVNAYGKDIYEDYTLANLLEEAALLNVPRLTFMTSHPWDFTDEMIDVIGKYPNIMPYVHLPLQSGSSKILKRMNRRYTKESYLELANKLKKRVPNLSLSTDIIVGFPGETDEDFEETLEIVKELKYDGAFSFIYSPRENTPAAVFKDQVPEEVARRRLQILNKELNKGFLESNQKLLGKTLKVLVNDKGNKEGFLYGYTMQNKLVNFKGDDRLIGSIVNVEITEAKTWSLDGKLS